MTKGKWEIIKFGDRLNTINCGDKQICEIGWITKDDKENAEIIALAGNLAQKFNLEALPEVVEALKDFLAGIIYKEMLETSKLTAFEENVARWIKQALSKIEVKQ